MLASLLFLSFTASSGVEALATRATLPLSERLASSAIVRGQANSADVNYEYGTFQRALYTLYQSTGNKTYYNYIQSANDKIVSSSGALGGGYVLSDYTLDDVKIGESLIYLYETTKSAKYKTAADTLRGQLNTHPRTAEGGLWHKKRYPNQQWLDGQYMALPFYADYTLKYQPTNQTAWTDILHQLQLVHTHTLQSSTGLLYHGYDYSKSTVWANPTTGASPEVWDRAVGWWSIALIDLLDYLPASQSTARTTILSYAKELAKALKDNAEKTSGAWYLVQSQPGKTGNYLESSGTAMFTYFLLKASRLGYIDSATYVPVGKKAYEYAAKTWVTNESDGTLGWTGTVSVGSLSGNGTYNYYISVATAKNDLKGLSPFILASTEYEKL